MFDDSKKWFDKNIKHTDSSILNSEEKVKELKRMADSFNRVNPKLQFTWEIFDNGSATLYGLISNLNPNEKVTRTSFANIDEALEYLKS